jgi:hypothetical protein
VPYSRTVDLNIDLTVNRRLAEVDEDKRIPPEALIQEDRASRLS